MALFASLKHFKGDIGLVRGVCEQVIIDIIDWRVVWIETYIEYLFCLIVVDSITRVSNQ